MKEDIMIINMLEAVSAMLEVKGGAISASKAECAKIMLDKIIEGMKDKDTVFTTNDTAPIQVIKQDEIVQVTPPSPPTPKRVPKPDEVEIMVDAGIIKSIKNAKDDTMIQLDGIAYPWRKAIGRSFSEGKVL